MLLTDWREFALSQLLLPHPSSLAPLLLFSLCRSPHRAKNSRSPWSWSSAASPPCQSQALQKPWCMCTAPPPLLQISEANRTALSCCLLPRRSCCRMSTPSLVLERLASPLVVPIIAIVQGSCLCFTGFEKRRSRDCRGPSTCCPAKELLGTPSSQSPATELCQGETRHDTTLRLTLFILKLRSFKPGSLRPRSRFVFGGPWPRTARRTQLQSAACRINSKIYLTTVLTSILRTFFRIPELGE